MIKRLFDLVVATIALVALSPLIAAIAIAVALTLGRPVLFEQERPGLHGRLIRFIKFRTMTDARDASGTLLDDSRRLTPFGSWLRRSSLDELPQLLSVIRGDLSLVGPRPLLPEYLPLYTPRQARRHDVRPGMTGWAQVNGRNSLDWPSKLELDVWYVEHRSFWLDLRILALTAKTIVASSDRRFDGSLAMERFRGGDA